MRSAAWFQLVMMPSSAFEKIASSDDSMMDAGNEIRPSIPAFSRTRDLVRPLIVSLHQRSPTRARTGQFDAKVGAVARAALHPDPAAMRFDDPAGNPEAQSQPLRSLRRRDTGKLLEDALTIRGVDAGTVVAHAQAGRVATRSDRHSHRTAGRIADRILQQ